MQSFWNEVHNSYFEEQQQCYCIDGWKTTNQDEEGKVIARVYKDRVTYHHNRAEADPKVQELVAECQIKFK